MSRIIGIDPGSRLTGYGIIEFNKNKIDHVDCGGIHPPKKDPVEKRLQYIHQKLTEIITKFRPDEASVEDVFFAKNAKSSLMLGQVRGVILLTLAEFGIPYKTYPPREVKKAITGFGGADKGQIQYMVKNLLRLTEEPFEDASDALAIAICHSQTLNLRRAGGPSSASPPQDDSVKQK